MASRHAVASLSVEWETRTLTASEAVPVRVYRPATSTRAPSAGWLVWAHGGSWQYGSAADWHGTTASLAALSGWTVVSVDYRLAPAHRHPAALLDVLTALDWARTQADGTRVAVGGDSAGGTLAACAALASRERGRPLAAQVLAYPPLDPACTAASYRRDTAAFPAAADLRRAWRLWRGAGPTLPSADDGTRLHSTPFEADYLDGLAPALLAAGRTDPVAGDAERYARLLRAAHVPVGLFQPSGPEHGDVLRPGSRLLRHLAGALRTLPSHDEVVFS
ncbi:alpha/beta hydrolase [Streptomyces sp. NPDC051840]|uniref:alpha/beta hydrolase n=1 Tax=Streptomyces sp. NPDC051840 TaxID=3154752 RepID=UPI003444CCBC